MKRGQSGLSLVVGVNKPTGMSSHDVVNRARRIFKERRVGHTGTLDPLASGVLPICIGPATRLDRYMVGHDKRYRVRICFGCETTTDDAEGDVTETGSIPSFLGDADFAVDFLSKTIGAHEQVPPRYSAVKVAGKKAYEAARAGDEIDLAPRRVEVYDAKLEGISSADEGMLGEIVWTVVFHVSKGTYIRSLARDIGRNLTCPAHVAALERLSAGRVLLEDCHTLQTIERLGCDAALDPLRILGLRYAFGEDLRKLVEAGSKLKEGQLALCEALPASDVSQGCACMGKVVESKASPSDGELVAVLLDNRMKSIYRFDAASRMYKPDCVFSLPISRV